MAVLRETKLQNFKISSCISIRRRTHAELQVVTLYSAMIDIFLLTQTLALALASNSLLLGFQCESKMIVCTCIGKRGSFFYQNHSGWSQFLIVSGLLLKIIFEIPSWKLKSPFIFQIRFLLESIRWFKKISKVCYYLP